MWFPSFASLALAGAVATSAYALPQTQEGQDSTSSSSSSTACNNSPSLCERNYNNITYLGGHNSPFVRDASTGNSLAGNQYLNATKALDAGLRLLQGQVHKSNNSLSLCHSSCDLMDAGPLADWLSAISDWMGNNPNDVVSILLVNQADATADEFGAVFESSGIGEYGYTPSSPSATSNWPTLQSMIDANTRLVSFVTNIDYSQNSPYVLNEFDFVFETHFEVTELSGFNCTLDRPKSADSAPAALSNGLLSLVNHFKYQELTPGIQFPDVDTIDVVNAAGTSEAGNLGLHVQACETEWASQPNFVLVDFFDEGDPLQAVDQLNGVSDATGRRTPEADTSGAASNHRGVGFGALLTFISAALLLV